MPNVFSADALKKTVEETIAVADIPDGHKNAVVFGVDETGAKVVAHFMLGPNDRWSLDAVYKHDWTGDNHVGANAVLSW